jgi:hypothetical protein
MGRLHSGFDLMYFDKSFLQTEKIFEMLKNNIYNDWGIFEHFLISLAEFNKSAYKLNLFEKDKIYKIVNNRELTNEPSQFLANSHKLNCKIFSEFIKNNHLSDNYLNLTYCHFKFRQVENSFKHYMYFMGDLFKFIIFLIKKNICKITPNFIKENIKQII